MNGIKMQNFGDQLISFLNEVTPFIFNNATSLFNISITIIVLLILLLWIVSGINLYKQILITYDLSGKRALKILLLVVCIIASPVAIIVFNIIKPKMAESELDLVKIEHKFFYHQASKVLDCYECGAYVLESHAYCTSCGSQNRYKCQKCNALNDLDSNYCFSCGINLQKRNKKTLSKQNNQNKSSNSSNIQSSDKKFDFEATLQGILQKIKNQFSKLTNFIKNLIGKAENTVSQKKKK